MQFLRVLSTGTGSFETIGCRPFEEHLSLVFFCKSRGADGLRNYFAVFWMLNSTRRLSL